MVRGPSLIEFRRVKIRSIGVSPKGFRALRLSEIGASCVGFRVLQGVFRFKGLSGRRDRDEARQTNNTGLQTCRLARRRPAQAFDFGKHREWRPKCRNASGPGVRQMLLPLGCWQSHEDGSRRRARWELEGTGFGPESYCARSEPRCCRSLPGVAGDCCGTTKGRGCRERGGQYAASAFAVRKNRGVR